MSIWWGSCCRGRGNYIKETRQFTSLTKLYYPISYILTSACLQIASRCLYSHIGPLVVTEALWFLIHVLQRLLSSPVKLHSVAITNITPCKVSLAPKHRPDNQFYHLDRSVCLYSPAGWRQYVWSSTPKARTRWAGFQVPSWITAAGLTCLSITGRTRTWPSLWRKG